MPAVSTTMKSNPAVAEDGEAFHERFGDFALAGPGGQRTHVDAVAAEGVHANPVAQQRAAGFPA